MKKKSIKSLKLNKRAISNFKNLHGGAASMPDHSTSRFCIETDMCPHDPIDIPTIDIPTWNDSCFSLCHDKCNDW